MIPLLSSVRHHTNKSHSTLQMAIPHHVRLLIITLVIAGALPNSLIQGQTRASFESWFSHYPILDDNDRGYVRNFTLADSFMGAYRFAESNSYCEKALQFKPDDYLVRAMMCLNYYEIAEPLNPKKSADRKKKLEIYRTMVHIAQDGIGYAPDRGECFFMRGLANARIATTKGILASLFMGKQMEHDWLEAVKHNSEYVTPHGENLIASCYIALASFYRLCPESILLKWFFGITGDIDKSIACAQKAYALDSTRIEIVKEYGISLITRGLKKKKPEDIENGKKYLTIVGTLPLRLRTDGIDKEHSVELLKDISLCPQYSRDQQQQDVSDKAINHLVKTSTKKADEHPKE
jgi:hypothetical protein